MSTSPPIPPPVERINTIDETADRLHVHPQTVRLWIRRGLLGHHMVGRRPMVAEDQLQTFLANRRHDVAS